MRSSPQMAKLLARDVPHGPLTTRWNGVNGLFQGHTLMQVPQPEPCWFPTRIAVHLPTSFGHFS